MGDPGVPSNCAYACQFFRNFIPQAQRDTAARLVLVLTCFRRDYNARTMPAAKRAHGNELNRASNRCHGSFCFAV